MIRLKQLLRETFLRHLFEIKDDPDYDATEDFFRRRDEQLYELATLLKQSGGKGRVPWKTVPASLLKRVWFAFGKYNRIKENDIDKIADQILTNIARLQASTEMMGHTSYDVRPEIEDNFGITFTDEEWEKWMSDYFTNDRGGWLLSDYGLEPLKHIYGKIFNADTPEQKLYACDKALNVVHQRGDLAAMFVEGGNSTLTAIANQGGHAYSGNYGDVNREFQASKLTENRFPAIKTKSGKVYIGRIHADAVSKTEEDLESVGWWEDGQYYTEDEARRKWGNASTDDLEPGLHRAWRLHQQVPEIPDTPVNENIFYRGENDSGKRIDEPFTVAKKLNATFASENPHNAKLYGHRITKFTAKPEAKILRYDSPTFWRLLKRRRPPNSWIGSATKAGEKLVDIVNYLTAIAYKQGYDAVVFSPTDDIGTMIFNKGAFDVSPTELKESGMSGKTFIVVDVQPEYQKFIHFIPRLVEFLNESYEEFGSLVFLYNGADTLGMVNESDYKRWWLENGLEESVMDGSYFYDKGYAFFRYCMDSGGLDDSVIANFVRFMYENDVRDSRDMTRDMWAKYLREYRRTDRKEVFELLHRASDCVHVPDLMDYLKRFNNIVVCGGGVTECLKEVEIALQALRKPYDVENRFTY